MKLSPFVATVGFGLAVWVASLASAKPPDTPLYCGTFPGDPCAVNVWKQEWGDSVYRELGNIGGVAMPRWPGHAALYIGFVGNEEMVMHASGDGSLELGQVTTGAFSGIHQHADPPLEYWGAFCNPKGLTHNDRLLIVSGAWNLYSDPDIGYTFADCVDYNGWTWSGEISDIDDLRCDGVVEYVFEAHGVDAWGKNGEHRDVTHSTDWCDEHNDSQLLYSIFDPDVNAFPCSQCGHEPNTSTALRPTIAASPEVAYEIWTLDTPTRGWYHKAFRLTWYVTDVSDIRSVSYKFGGDRLTSSTGWSKVQYADTVAHGGGRTLVDVDAGWTGWYYCFGEDRAGNYPQNAAGVYLQIDGTGPEVSLISPSGYTHTTDNMKLDIVGDAKEFFSYFPVSGIYTVEAFDDSGTHMTLPVSGQPASNRFTFADYPLARGVQTIKIRATDYAGNAGFVHSLEVTCTAKQLTILSTPVPGAAMTVSPDDRLGESDGETSLHRFYRTGESVTVTAPAFHGGAAFLRWEKDGAAYSTSRTVSVTMDVDHTLVAVFLDVLAPPATPSGPTTGTTLAAYSYATVGASHPSHPGHGLEFEFDWGSGPSGVWGSDTQSHTWMDPFVGFIKVRARCALHHDFVSDWSGRLYMAMLGESVRTISPYQPTGTSTCIQTVSYNYTGWAESTVDHALEYQFDWGDGSALSAWGAQVQSHAWLTSPAIWYEVRYRARCAVHTDRISAWSLPLHVGPLQTETVSTPTAPSGNVLVALGQTQNYVTGGAASSMGHVVEYEFDWGKGESGSWASSEQPFQWHTLGEYVIRARARCREHSVIVSGWSVATTVTVANVGIDNPVQPAGETNGVVGTVYTFWTHADVTPEEEAKKITFEYDWGSGPSGVWGLPTQSHTWWPTAGTMPVRVRARLKDPKSGDVLLSGWSPTLVANMRAEQITRPIRVIGNTNCVAGQAYTYTFDAESNGGHPLEYRFRWGGTVDSWAGSSRVHVWPAAGSYNVNARARCATHTIIESPDSLWVQVTVLPADSVPQTPVPVAPPDQSVQTDRTPLLTWTDPLANATWFRMCLRGPAGTVADIWTQTPLFLVSTELTGGIYRWWVHGQNQYGSGEWAGPTSFTIPWQLPDTAVPLSPVGLQELGERRPVFSWQAADDADWYNIWVTRVGEGKYAEKWVQAPATTWTPGIDFVGGDYRWWLAGWNVDGYGSWSAPTDFTIPWMQPGAIGLLSPTGGIDVATGDVTYQWAADDRATWYELWCGRNGSVFVDTWYQGTGVVSGATVSTTIADHGWGSYGWWVRGWGPDGMGDWSGRGGFFCGRPTPVSGDAETLTWMDSWTASAEWYQIWINDVTGGGSVKERTRWFPQSETKAGAGQRVVLLDPVLPTGDYQWWIRAWNSTDDLGPWSEARPLTIP